MYTPFEGDKAGIHAMNWVHKDAFVWRDFPASEGWTHFFHCNDEAAKEKGDYLTAQLFEQSLEGVEV